MFFDLPAVFDLEAMIERRHRDPLGARARRPHRRHAPRRRHRRRHVVRDRPVLRVPLPQRARRRRRRSWSTGAGRPGMPTAFGDDGARPSPCRPLLHRWTIDLAAGTVTETPARRPARRLPPHQHDALGPRQPLRLRRPTARGTPTWCSFDARRQARPRDRHDRRCTTTARTPRPARRCSRPIPTARPRTTAGCSTSSSTAPPRRATLVIVDARDIEGDPVARSTCPAGCPFGFHGNWMPDRSS